MSVAICWSAKEQNGGASGDRDVIHPIWGDACLLPWRASREADASYQGSNQSNWMIKKTVSGEEMRMKPTATMQNENQAKICVCRRNEKRQ